MKLAAGWLRDKVRDIVWLVDNSLVTYIASTALVVAIVFLGGCPQKGGPGVRDGHHDRNLKTDLATPTPAMPTRPADMIAADTARLHVIDVGQGLAVLVEFPCGTLLYDTGGEQNQVYDGLPALTAYLDHFFAARPERNNTIDLLVVSHPHIDHTRGLPIILDRYTVKNVVDNGNGVADLGGLTQVQMHEWLAARGDSVPYFAVRRGDVISIDGLTNAIIDPFEGCEQANTDPTIRALWGGHSRPREMGENANNNSVVLRIDYGATSFLLPGDLEIVGWAKMTKKLGKNNPVFDVDVYVVGHHGSKNATVEYQVKLMSPKLAVISAGPFARYLRTEEEFTARVFAHPNARAIRHLIDDDYGVSMWRSKPIRAWVGIKGQWKQRLSTWEEWAIRKAVYSTAWDGSVIVDGNANGFLAVSVELPESKWRPRKLHP